MFVALFATAAPATADECTKDQKAASKPHFDEAAKAFRLNNLSKAADEFKAAYEACPMPLFLYNLGQTYRQLKDNEQALYFYKQFLSAVDQSDPRRGDVQKWIDQLNQQIENQQRLQQAPPPGPATPPPSTAQAITPSTPTEEPPRTAPHAWYRTSVAIAGFSLVGLAVASTGVAAGLFVRGNDYNAQVASAPSIPQADAAASSRDSYWNGSYAMFAVAGASAIAGAVLIAIAGSRRNHLRTSLSVVPTVVGGGILVGAGGSL